MIARILGPEESGYYFLALAIVAILAAFSRIGLDYTVVRYIGADTSQSASVLKKAVILVGCTSLTCALFLFVFAEPLALHLFRKAELVSVLKPISFGVSGLALLTLGGSALQGLRKAVPSVFVTGVILNIALIAVLLFYRPTTAASLAGFYALLSVATALIGFLYFLRSRPVSADTDVQFKRILESCMPLWLVILMQQLVQWSGQFMAGVYLEPESISLLACAQRTAMLVSFVLLAVNLVVAPRFAELYKQGELRELESIALASVKLVSILALPVILLMICFPREIMMLFGPEFVAAGPLLRILAVGQFFNAICGSVGILLIMSGNERDVRNVALVSGVFALASVWLLTVYFGESGNALGTAAAVAGQNFMTVYFVKKRFGFNTLAVWRSGVFFTRIHRSG